MKKFFSTLVSSLLVLVAVFSFTGCASVYEVDMGLGNANVENDRISAKFKIDEVISVGYEMMITFTAEKDADLSGNFDFGIVYYNSEQEFYNGEFESDYFCSINKDMFRNGKIEAGVKLNYIGDYLKAENGVLVFAFCRQGAKPSEITKFATSKFEYHRDGDKFTLVR